MSAARVNTCLTVQRAAKRGSVPLEEREGSKDHEHLIVLDGGLEGLLLTNMAHLAHLARHTVRPSSAGLSFSKAS